MMSGTSPDGKSVRIEAGTTALVMPWTLHRHQLYWEKPRAFMPERFLRRTAARSIASSICLRCRSAICIGATLAMQEAVIALAVLMARYRLIRPLEPTPGLCRSSRHSRGMVFPCG